MAISKDVNVAGHNMNRALLEHALKYIIELKQIVPNRLDLFSIAVQT